MCARQFWPGRMKKALKKLFFFIRQGLYIFLLSATAICYCLDISGIFNFFSFASSLCCAKFHKYENILHFRREAAVRALERRRKGFAMALSWLSVLMQNGFPITNNCHSRSSA
jgi:hypothetical protein